MQRQGVLSGFKSMMRTTKDTEQKVFGWLLKMFLLHNFSSEVEREPFTLKPRKEKEEATTTEKQSITITEVQTEKLFLPESPTPPPPPPPITDFYPPSKPSNYNEKLTTEAPTPAPQDKKKGLLTSLFSLIFAPKTKKKTETTTETVTVFIPDETTTASPQISTTERHYLPPPTEAAPPPTLAATTPRPPATTTVPPVPVHVHHIIQPVHIPIPQPVHVQHPVHVQQPVHVQHPIHVPVSHHVPQSQIQLIGLQQFSLPVCTSSPVSSFQRCLPPASASLPLTQSSIGHVPLNAGFVRLPRNINQLQQQHLTLVRNNLWKEQLVFRIESNYFVALFLHYLNSRSTTRTVQRIKKTTVI